MRSIAREHREDGCVYGSGCKIKGSKREMFGGRDRCGGGGGVFRGKHSYIKDRGNRKVLASRVCLSDVFRQ